MSNIIVQLDGINGDRSVTIGQTTFANNIQCRAMMHAIDLPLAVANNARTEGASVHGPIGFVHEVDKATPPLRGAAAAGNEVTSAVIRRLRMSAGALEIAEEITLSNVYVVRIDIDMFLNDANHQPDDTVLETFWLEYRAINWDYKYRSGPTAAPTSVVKTWDTSALSA